MDAVNWDDGFAYTAPVGRFAPNPFGLHDVIGNVWEWCDDEAVLYSTGLARSSDARRNTAGQSGAGWRSLRGGSWLDPTRSAIRGRNPPSARRSQLGLRPARTITE